MEATNVIICNEVLSDLVNKEVEYVDGLNVGAKERQVCWGNVKDTIKLVHEGDRIEQDLYNAEENRKLERERLKQQADIEKAKMEFEREKLNRQEELEQLKIDAEAELKNSEDEIRRKQMRIDLIKVGVEIGLTVFSACFANAMFKKTAHFETEGSFTSVTSKHTMDLMRPFERKAGIR